jgi:hypothetical protein
VRRLQFDEHLVVDDTGGQSFEFAVEDRRRCRRARVRR